MLQVNKTIRSAKERPDEDLTIPASEILKNNIAFLRRHFWLFFVIPICTILLSIIYLYITPPSFTASGTMILDARKLQVLQQQSVLGDLTLDAAAVQSQIEVLKSRNIAYSVIKSLNLIKDPEFVGGPGGLKSKLFKLSGFPEKEQTPNENDRLESALASFEARRTVSRVGVTYVMEIGFRSLNAEKSARIVNAIADAYVTDQLESKFEATRRAGAWLQERLADLKAQVAAADGAIVNFKRANNIVESLNGRLINEQDVSEINGQLLAARAAKNEAKARLDQIQEVINQDLPDASVTDTLHNELLVKLRAQYLEYAGRERIYAERYGPNHLATLNLLSLMAELKHNIADEVKKIAETDKSDYEVAVKREKDLTKSLSEAVSASQATNQAGIKLRELESNAQSTRAVYETFLQRYMESVQQQSFGISESRLISPAIVPRSKSQPNTALVVSGSTFAGIVLALMLAVTREFSDRVFRTAVQVEGELGLNCIAILPALKSNKSNPPNSLSHISEETAETCARMLQPAPNLLRHVVDSPFSHYAEGLRALKVVVKLNNVLKPSKVIGMTSALPNEGKSTLASNFGHLIAHAGERVLLIDCDLRNPTLSRTLTPTANVGLVDIIAGKVELNETVWKDPQTGLFFLPSGSTNKLLHTDQIIASENMERFISYQRDTFDYIIFDFPPLSPVVDTRNSTNFVDFYVFIVEWGETARFYAKTVLAQAPEVSDRILGAVLNKANLAKMARYEGYPSRLNYRKHYDRYGVID